MVGMPRTPLVFNELTYRLGLSGVIDLLEILSSVLCFQVCALITQRILVEA